MPLDRLLPRIRFTVVCEDTRREDNGKFLFVGVFGRDIGVAQLPAQLVFSLAVNMVADETGEFPFDIRITFAGETVSEGKGAFRIPSTGVSFVTLRNLFVEIKQEGLLSFDLKFEDADWQSLYQLPLLTRASGPVPPT